jgi:hypothetical protein
MRVKAMTSIYEIHKANRIGRANDFWTALVAQKWKASEEEFKEYTGSVPVTFTADGTPLLDYTIYGNMTQSSECGERTKNLFDKDNAPVIHIFPTASGVVSERNDVYSIILPCKPNTTYTYSKLILPHRMHRVAGYAEYPTLEMQSVFLDESSETIEGDEYAQNIFTTTADARWLLIIVAAQGTYDDYFNLIQKLQVEESNGRTSYEPYGYKIPISVNGQTNNIYIGSEPLRKAVDGSETADTLNYSTQQFIRRVGSSGNALAEPETVTLEVPEIPTVDGQNTIDVLTELKPSEVYIKYKGR